MIYALFATSKDVTIGPVAVMSLEVARVIAHVQDKTGDLYSAPEIATAVAFLCGFIVLGIGLLRLGWIIELYVVFFFSFLSNRADFSPRFQHPSSGDRWLHDRFGAQHRCWSSAGAPRLLEEAQVCLPLISSFFVAHAFYFSTRGATYRVIIDTLKHLPDTQRDAAFGLSGLFFLYLVRWGFARLERRSRNPVVKKIAFFATTLRTAFVIIILTAAAYAYCKDQETPKISILKTVPSGFKHMGQPKLPKGLLSAIAPELPVSTIILLLEHIVRFSFFPFFSN
jgi:sodium-independent sulfate anion transporter 11